MSAHVQWIVVWNFSSFLIKGNKRAHSNRQASNSCYNRLTQKDYGSAGRGWGQRGRGGHESQIWSAKTRHFLLKDHQQECMATLSESGT